MPQRIALPECNSLKLMQLCEKTYMFMTDDQGATKVAEIVAGGKIEPVAFIPKLLNAVSIPSNDDKLLMAGQEYLNGPWKNWLFTCKMK